MNAPSFDDLRNGRDLSDEKMEQVRELLFGDAVRLLEARMRHMEVRLADLESSLNRQFNAVETRLQALTSSSETDRRAAFEALASSILDLGEQVRRISRG
ncbi:MAG: hypothetical protein AB7S74_14820 [Hyphomicrobium sp.]